MKTFVRPSIVLAVLALSGGASAGPGGSCHFHGSKPATEAVVVDCANQRRDALVASGKLDNGWSAIPVGKPELVDGSKGKEWRVTFTDPAAKDKAKGTLYMFFTPPGNFVAANFSGK